MALESFPGTWTESLALRDAIGHTVRPCTCPGERSGFCAACIERERLYQALTQPRTVASRLVTARRNRQRWMALEGMA